MKLKLIGLTVAGLLAISSLQAKQAQKLQVNVNYIEKYASVAIIKMQEHGIPASITLAQGLLESGAGQSELAKKSNNHFGIKCHNDWTGDKVYYDDDKKQECFRKYKSAELSYEDHSQFLKKDRYKKLFDLDVRDYKAWAKGLKECGYATDPNYAKRLIEIIEMYELYNYDNGIIPVVNNTETDNNVIAPLRQKTRTMGKIKAYRTHKTIKMGKMTVVKAEKGDTYESIAKEFSLHKWQIRKYNQLNKKDNKQPEIGESVVIKRR